eukprot:GHVN01050856.1.p2 GENE.GHVN01050856.1~~GHVN01050856.1.p2  ORF type:complete len:246 (+),score=38.16 GHVN01050856.1:554-1291(+)
MIPQQTLKPRRSDDEELKSHGSYVLQALREKLREEEIKHPEAHEKLKNQTEGSPKRQSSLHKLKTVDQDDPMSTHGTYAMGSLQHKLQSRCSPVQLEELRQDLKKAETFQKLNTMQTIGTKSSTESDSRLTTAPSMGSTAKLPSIESVEQFQSIGSAAQCESIGSSQKSKSIDSGAKFQWVDSDSNNTPSTDAGGKVQSIGSEKFESVDSFQKTSRVAEQFESTDFCVRLESIYVEDMEGFSQCA